MYYSIIIVLHYSELFIDTSWTRYGPLEGLLVETLKNAVASY